MILGKQKNTDLNKILSSVLCVKCNASVNNTEKVDGFIETVEGLQDGGILQS